jgi:ubiquinone/menaquinone biosynthesis C-methylase UbiE
MAYSQKLRKLFPDISLCWEDLLLLEAFQVKYLPSRVSQAEFAVLIHEYPLLHRFLIQKYPPIASFLSGLLKDQSKVEDPLKVQELCEEALWEIADLIIYNKHPDVFDAQAPLRWELEDINSAAPLKGKKIADVGAGSGRIAFLVAPLAGSVYAIEPLHSFRSFMKEKALGQKVSNFFVMDGTLDSIPLPENSLDILITSNAMGWNLEEELAEIERVVKNGGYAIHLFQAEKEIENLLHDVLVSPPWNYDFLEKKEGSTHKLRYHKSIKKA